MLMRPPGTANWDPRDSPPEIALLAKTVSAETEPPTAEPANCGPVAGRREISQFERVRGGGRSRSRTCLHRRFPANREKNREFFNFSPDRGSGGRVHAMISMT